MLPGLQHSQVRSFFGLGNNLVRKFYLLLNILLIILNNFFLVSNIKQYFLCEILEIYLAQNTSSLGVYLA